MSEEKIETPDIDSMSDEQVADLKKGMREEAPEKEEAKAPGPDKKADKPFDRDDTDDEVEEVRAGEKQETVPHGKFHRANERAKAEKARADAAERQSSIAMQRLTELLEASKPPPPEPVDEDPEPIGDPNNPKFDPIARIAWDTRELARIKARMQERDGSERAYSEQQQAWNDALTQVNARWMQQTAEKPELNDAYQYTLRSYAREFAANGEQGMLENGTIVPGSPLAKALERHEAQVIAYCYQKNLPIEDYLVDIATARGWSKGNGKDTSEEGQSRTSNGQFAKAETEKIDRLNDTKAKSKSLGGSGAPVEMAEITPQMLIDMSEEDFAAYKKKHGEKAMRKAFGAA